MQQKKKERDTMLVKKTIDVTQPPTEEQIEMLKRAEEMPIADDKDLPALTSEQLEQFKNVIPQV